MKSKRLPTQDYIGPQIKTLSILIEKKMNAQLVANGINLTGTQISILAFLYDHQKTVTQKEIELKFKISHPTVRGIIRRLVALNLVETTTSDQDLSLIHILPGATHTDLYDGGDHDYIPFDKIDSFFKKNL